ncbi:unnamed protein product [[Candida] boidinii]|nr:unnamed protein product [[Candida] boidinii]
MEDLIEESELNKLSKETIERNGDENGEADKITTATTTTSTGNSLTITPTISTSINGLDGDAVDDHADADDEHVDDEGDADDDDEEEEEESAFERPKLEVKLEVNFQNAS